MTGMAVAVTSWILGYNAGNSDTQMSHTLPLLYPMKINSMQWNLANMVVKRLVNHAQSNDPGRCHWGILKLGNSTDMEILLVDGVWQRIHCFGLHELFQTIKIHITCYFSLQQRKNPVILSFIKPHQTFISWLYW